ncbi:ketopantoate reductase family protein [Frondihabitans australicus]|uniref:2-dehydropantoate 2-reductase n=1 Tax=Frondihabitans australicus TaxID=386892 RepID=A0A495IJ75_9MICO|nr:2-dehydropantoate 2-reductase N-terminal domain-containing protein [Frondihabitans australicus]RKR76072.1 2-dehydropantoate 2-reductase [Frondihabitans australicus]
MRYVIIGAGAIGGTLGGRLAQHSSTPPLLIARGAHGEALASTGLRLRSPDEDVTVPVVTASSPDDVRLLVDDVLVIATKTQSVEAALQDWVDQPVFSDPSEASLGSAGDLLPLFTALNGVASERIASRYFARVFAVCVWLPAVHLTPGEVVVRIAPSSGTFIIGRYGRAADDADRALLAALEADWTAATFRIFLTDDVMAWKHRKLLSNLGNAVQALVGPSAPKSIHDRLAAEGGSVLEASGITWPSDAEEEAWRGDAFDVRPVSGVTGDLGGSSWQSMKRGGSIESDFLNGEIALMARLVGHQAPLNATVQRLARQAAGAGAGPGSMTGAELLRALDAAG